MFSEKTAFQSEIFKNITFTKFTSVFHRRTMPVSAVEYHRMIGGSPLTQIRIVSHNHHRRLFQVVKTGLLPTRPTSRPGDGVFQQQRQRFAGLRRRHRRLGTKLPRRVGTTGHAARFTHSRGVPVALATIAIASRRHLQTTKRRLA